MKTEEKGKVTPAAAEPLKQGRLEMIAVSALEPSLTNPRKVFEENAMKDLLASIKDKGVIQPLVVRRKGSASGARARYEIVCGERRYKASMAAGLQELPCMISELTDQQVVEIQIIENMQRADLSPLEEAHGYDQLHDKYKYDWPELAARVGKSQEYVFTRLNLLKLIPEFQAKLAKGELKLTYAEEITKIQSPEEQKKLAVYWKDNAWAFDELESLKTHIRDHYLLQLRCAPFPVKAAGLPGGPCGQCAKRTGAQSDLFGDLQGKNDTCRDASCWAEKKKEYEKQGLEKYDEYVKKGHKVLIGAAAEAAMAKCIYAKTTDKPEYGLPDKFKTWGQAIEGKDYKTIIAVDSNGRKHELVNTTAVSKMYHDSRKSASPSKREKDLAVKMAEGKLKEEAGNLAAIDVLKPLEEKIDDIDVLSDVIFLRMLVDHSGRVADVIEKVWGLTPKVYAEGTRKHMEKILVAQAIGSQLIEDGGSNWNGPNLKAGKPRESFREILEHFDLQHIYNIAFKSHLEEVTKTAAEEEAKKVKEAVDEKGKRKKAQEAQVYLAHKEAGAL